MDKKEQRRIKKVIKGIMLKKDVKTGKLADLIGMESTHASVWLARNDGQTIDRLVQIGEALGCDLAFIDKETGEIYK